MKTGLPDRENTPLVARAVFKPVLFLPIAEQEHPNFAWRVCIASLAAFGLGPTDAVLDEVMASIQRTHVGVNLVALEQKVLNLDAVPAPGSRVREP